MSLLRAEFANVRVTWRSPKRLSALCLAGLPMRIGLISAMFVSFSSCQRGGSAPPVAHSPSEPEREIEKRILDQVEAWNRGDLVGFMQAYWQSEKLTFSSGGNTRRGWQTIHDHYQTRYGGKTDLGQLTFSDLETNLLNPDHALVLGRWHLTTGESTMEGNFTLVLRRIDQNWVIIHDHTSLTQAPE